MRGDESKRQKQSQELIAQLARNGLVRKSLPQGPRSMFRAICDSLYYNPDYSTQLVTLCKLELERMFQSRSLPYKLQHLYDNPSILSDYKENPDLSGFTKVHLELISCLYSAKITIYYLSEDYYLNSLIINCNSNNTKSIMLSRVQNYYSAVFDQETFEIAKFIRELIYEKLLLESSKSNHKEEKQASKRQHKKSLSACDELEYKQIFQPVQAFFEFVKKPTLQKVQSYEETDDDLDLIKECNKNIPRKKSGLYQQLYMDQMLKFGNNNGMYRYQEFRFPSQKVLSLPGGNQSVNNNAMQHNQINPKPKLPPKTPLDKQVTDSSKRYTGRLKFFDENKNYGFIVIDEDFSDIFVHYDDLSKAGMTKEFMRTTKHGNIIRFEFSCMVYIGKYDKSRKAVELTPIENDEYHLV